MQTAGLGLCRNRHGNQFHTRIHIPKDLVQLVGRAELRLSLGTEVRRYAIRSARLIHALKITAFDELRTVMDTTLDPTPEQQAQARERLLRRVLERREALGAPDGQEGADEALYAIEADRQQAQERLTEMAQQMSHDDVLALLMVAEEKRGEVLQCQSAIAAADMNRQAAIEVAARSLNEAEQAKLKAAKSEQEARVVSGMAAKSAFEHAQVVSGMAMQMAELSLKAVSAKSKESPSTASATAGAARPVMFSELVAEFDAVTSVGKRGRTNAQYLQEAKMFEWVMGDMPVCDITEQVMAQFWQIIKQLPPNINKSKRYQGKSPEEIIELGDAPVNIRTAKQRLDRLGSIFVWALKKSANPDHWGIHRSRNPVAAVVLTREEKSDLNVKSQRRPFSDEDLHKLFTGQKVEGTGAKAASYGYGARRFKKRTQYWLPLLALLTGARGNELAQLRLSDICRDASNVPYLHINELPDEDGQRRKSTKNTASQRKTPLHPRLVALGFLDYVQHLKERGHLFLFPELRPEDVGGREVFGSEMTNWFKRFREGLGVVKNEDGEIVFHSFRHTVTTRLHSAGVNDTDVADILGHEQATEAGRTYMHMDMSYKLANLVKMNLHSETLDAVPSWREVAFGEALPAPSR